MSTSLRFMLGLPLVLIVPSWLRGSDETLAFEPKLFAVLEKRFTEETEWTVDEVRVIVGGSEVSMAPPAATAELVRSVVLIDEIGKAEGPRILELERGFETARSELRLEVDLGEGEESYSATSESALAGARVRFTRDVEGERYEAELVEGGAEGADLEGLEVDVDFTAFLPAKAVQEGDTWRVDPAALTGVFRPGGDLSFLPGQVPSGSFEGSPTPFLVAPALMTLGDGADAWIGQVKARFVGVSDEDGARIAEIALELDVTGEGSLDEELERWIAASQDQDYAEPQFTLGLELDAEATLKWDLEARRPHAFELAGDLGLKAKVSFEVEIASGAEPQEMAAHFTAEGSTAIKYARGE